YKISMVDFKASDWEWVDPEEKKGHNELWIQDGGEIGEQLDDGEYPTAEDPWDWKWDGVDIRFDRDGDGDFYGEADTVFLGADFVRPDRNKDGLIDTAQFDVTNQRFDLRLDYDFSPSHGFVFGFGQALATNINITGIARYLAEDWTYRYYHLRYINNDLFIQSYLNTSNSGVTRNLRTGERIKDESTFFHFQVQHTVNFNWPVETRVSYGTDYQRTMPKTHGTILPDGQALKSYDNDGKDNDDDGEVDEYSEGLIVTNEYGLYFQSTSIIMPKLEFILAGRLDLHNGERDENGIKFIEDPLLGGTMKYRAQYSPKIGLLWKPVENQTFRLTVARASNTPSSQGLYLDITAGIAASSLVKARGNHSGYHFERAPDGTLMMYDVRPGSASEFRLAQIPDSAILYIPDVLGRPSQFVQVEDVKNIAPVTSELIWTYELGYSGIINNRLRATFDAYYSEYGDFVSDLTWITPIVMDTLKYGFNSDAVIGLLGTSEHDGIDIGEDGIPGTADDKVDFANPRELTLTNINYGRVTLGGLDMSLAYFFSPRVMGEVRFSYLGTKSFYNPLTKAEDPVNAPQYKISLSGKYSGRDDRFWIGFAARQIPTFDWSAGVFYGTIESYLVVDLNAGYRINDMFTLKANINNLNGQVHREIIGGAFLGRQIVVNLTMGM
ncbi:MAG: TonB-dependent receptor, partial [Candidatus Neomarinimicrobiota bacterium]